MNNKPALSYFAALLLFLVGLGGFFVWKVLGKDNDQPELLMGIFVVTAIAALMTLLYILAAGFNFMNLTDPKQALGLPEGSIRAMIALILIIAFIIFGIYLFRSVGDGVSTTLESKIPVDSLKNINMGRYKDLQTYIQRNSDSTFSIIAVQKTSDEGYKLAQQLLTTVGTLVVAISSFYFGSTTVNSAITSAMNNLPGQPQPLPLPTEPVKPVEPADIKPVERKEKDENVEEIPVAGIPSTI